jgi:hypothetical protein
MPRIGRTPSRKGKPTCATSPAIPGSRRIARPATKPAGPASRSMKSTSTRTKPSTTSAKINAASRSFRTATAQTTRMRASRKYRARHRSAIERPGRPTSPALKTRCSAATASPVSIPATRTTRASTRKSGSAASRTPTQYCSARNTKRPTPPISTRPSSPTSSANRVQKEVRREGEDPVLHRRAHAGSAELDPRELRADR